MRAWSIDQSDISAAPSRRKRIVEPAPCLARGPLQPRFATISTRFRHFRHDHDRYLALRAVRPRRFGDRFPHHRQAGRGAVAVPEDRDLRLDRLGQPDADRRRDDADRARQLPLPRDDVAPGAVHACRSEARGDHRRRRLRHAARGAAPPGRAESHAVRHRRTGHAHVGEIFPRAVRIQRRPARRIAVRRRHRLHGQLRTGQRGHRDRGFHRSGRPGRRPVQQGLLRKLPSRAQGRRHPGAAVGIAAGAARPDPRDARGDGQGRLRQLPDPAVPAAVLSTGWWSYAGEEGGERRFRLPRGGRAGEGLPPGTTAPKCTGARRRCRRSWPRRWRAEPGPAALKMRTGARSRPGPPAMLVDRLPPSGRACPVRTPSAACRGASRRSRWHGRAPASRSASCPRHGRAARASLARRRVRRRVRTGHRPGVARCHHRRLRTGPRPPAAAVAAGRSRATCASAPCSAAATAGRIPTRAWPIPNRRCRWRAPPATTSPKRVPCCAAPPTCRCATAAATACPTSTARWPSSTSSTSRNWKAKRWKCAATCAR